MVVLRHTKEADEREFGRIIRQHLERHDGRVGIKFRSRDRTDTRGAPSSIKRREAAAIARRADGLAVVIPPDATKKQIKRPFKNARYKRNVRRRLDTMAPAERAAEEERLRERNRGYAARARESEDAKRADRGLPPQRRTGPRRSTLPPTVIPPDLLAEPEADS